VNHINCSGYGQVEVLVNMVMNHVKPHNAGKIFIRWENISFSRRSRFRGDIHLVGYLVTYVTLLVIRKQLLDAVWPVLLKKTWPSWQDSSPSFAVWCELYAINLGALHRSDECRELFCFFLTSRRWDLMNIWSTKRFQVISRADYSQRKCCRMKRCCMTIPFSFSWGCLTL